MVRRGQYAERYTSTLRFGVAVAGRRVGRWPPSLSWVSYQGRILPL